MRTITHLIPRPDWTLEAIFADGAVRIFDLKPHLECQAFQELKELGQFLNVRNGGYYVEWPCGADLSADTLYLEGRAA